jgi:hypothetical protein
LNISFAFFIPRFLKNKAFFEKIVKKFQPPPPRVKKNWKFLSRRRQLPEGFLTAAAEDRKKLKILSRRR